MPVEERRKLIYGGLAAAPCRRHPHQAHSAHFFILKLGIADSIEQLYILGLFSLSPSRYQ